MLEDYGNALSSTKNDSDFETQPYADTPLPYVEAPHVKMPSPSTATPSTPSDQPPASPTEENQLAAAYQLGNVLKCYKSEPTAFTTDDLPIAPATRRASGPNNSGGFFLIILAPTLLIWLLTRTPPWPLIMLCLLMLAPWLSNVIGSLPSDVFAALQNTEFYLCTNGLMIIKWTRVRPIRWEQIRAVQYCRERNILDSYYILYLDEGKPVTLKRSLVGDELNELAEAVESEVRQRRLPEAIAAYEAGQALSFGPISVTAKGLVLEEEQQSLSWQHFTSVDYYNGYYLTIREGATASPWQKIEVASMLNLCVFLPLITYIKNSLLAKERSAMYEERTIPHEEMERMGRRHEEKLEHLRNRREITPLPEEVIEALRVLDLPSDASFVAIHQRYRQLAKRYHPDAGGDPETFRQINAAYKCVVAWIESQE